MTGTKPGVTAGRPRTSAASAAIEPGTQTLQPTPTITGTPRAGRPSTGVQGTWDTGTTKTYKWYADGVEIAGATTTTYTPTLAQIGQVLTFEVTSTRTGYTTVTKTSEGKTVAAAGADPEPTPTSRARRRSARADRRPRHLGRRHHADLPVARRRRADRRRHGA